ncbi:uncharacterized protein isoform X2 [Leptinotarsa decemlineata]|uniref:uncharacterized protein isoform X2 n=1 Tax=Leptinotarsa decemlineata TaxID=7539 RepID=UPI003D3050AB
METETLTNYEQTKEKHLENEPMDVVTNEPESPQTKNVCEESSESTGYIENQKSPPHVESKDFPQGDCDKSRIEEHANESEDEVNDHDLGRIEAESDEDCEEEEKLLLSPTHSDKEYDTDEEDDREHMSADENGADEDTDEEDEKVHIREATEKHECDDKVKTGESSVIEDSEKTSSPLQTKSSNERTDVKDHIDKENEKFDEHEIDETDDVDKIDNKNNENETDENTYKNDEIDEAKESEEKKSTTKRAVDDDDDLEKTGNDIGKTGNNIEKTDDRDTFNNEILNDKDEDHIEGMNVEEVDPLGNTSETVTVEQEETKDLTTDTSDPLSTKSEEKEVKEVENSVLPSGKDNENKKQDGDKVIPMTSEKPEENKSETKGDKRSQDMEVKGKTSQDSPTEEKNGDEAKCGDSIRVSTESETTENTEGGKDPDCPLLKESLTKSSDCDKSEAYEDVEMDEDFDPSLLCPELSMEVDEAPVITENDSTTGENDPSKSPLRLYEPIFSTVVDEITGTEIDFQLTEEEHKLREQTYGAKNPVQYTKIHCTACNVHLGSALDGQGNRFVHPLLKVLICKKCYHFYTSGEFEKDEDGSELYCRWCGQGGQVMCCSNCEMVFCKKCIRINFDRKKIAAIRDSDDWLCFRCNPSQLIHLRIHCSEFMEYVQREMANVSSMENPAAYLTTDYCQCCIPHKKKAAEPAAGEPKRKRKKPSEPEDPDYDPFKDRDTPSPAVATASPATVAPVPEKAAPPPLAKAPETPKAPQTGGPQKIGHVPANAAFRTVGPGHTPRPRVQVVQQGPVRPTSSPGYVKIMPSGVRVPGNASIRPPALRPLRPNVPQMKHEWFEKTVRAAARVNSNLSYTLTQLNRAQASATSVEGLAVVHNKLQEILSTSINSLIQIRKNLRTEFIAGIKNIRFPPKPQSPQQPAAATTAAQDDDVIFVSPATSPVPPPLTSSSSLPAVAANLPPSVTLTKKYPASPNTSKPGPSGVTRAGPSAAPKPGPSGVNRAGPSGVNKAAPASQQSKPGSSGVSRNTPAKSDQGNGPKTFLRVKSFSALQNVPSECITIPDDPVPEEKTGHISEDDDVIAIEKKVEIVTILDDSPMKSPEREEDQRLEKADSIKSNLCTEKQPNGLTNGSEDGEEENKKETTVSIEDLDPVEKLKILNTKILLQRSSEIDELVKSKFGLLNGEVSN